MTRQSRQITPIDIEELTRGGPVIVLAPHPDDERLGCGGLISACRKRGIAVHIVCMTNGAASHPNSRLWPPVRLAARRRLELVRAIRHLGCGTDALTCLDYPDGPLGAEDAGVVAAALTNCRDRLGAKVLLAPSPADHHEDHKATAAIARLLAVLCPTLRLWFYPVWSRWDDPSLAAAHLPSGPRCFAILPEREAKSRAVRAHESQLGMVVPDDHGGFVLPEGLVALFVDEPEINFEAASFP